VTNQLMTVYVGGKSSGKHQLFKSGLRIALRRLEADRFHFKVLSLG